MDDGEVFEYVARHLHDVQKPEFYPVLEEDASPDGSPEFFARHVGLVFPAVADYLGAGRLGQPRVFRPDDGSYRELVRMIAEEAGIQERSARKRLRKEMGPTMITFNSGELVIWSGYFRPHSQLFYREAALEEAAHYVHLTLSPC